MKTGSLRILHLSDVHFGQTTSSGTRWRLRHVLGDAWQRNLDAIVDDGRPDVVCFTGDIAFSGEEHEYAEASVFFDELLASLAVPKSRLFVVPGNHDIRRGKKDQIKLWLHIRQTILKTDRRDVSAWMSGGRTPLGFESTWRTALLKRQAAYRAWLTAYGLNHCLPGTPTQRHPHLGYRATLSDWAQPLHIIGLDSAWLAGDDHDAEKLRITDEQLARHLTQANDEPLDGVRLVLMHHPLSTLADGDEIRGQLRHHGAQFLLHGHVHKASAAGWKPLDRNDTATTECAAGCLYGHNTFPNSFQLFDLELPAIGEASITQVWTRTWTANGGGRWDNDNFPLAGSVDGRWRPKTIATPRLPQGGCFGRDILLGDISAHLLGPAPTPDAPRCMVLTGMPGVGKSRLAHTFVREHWAVADGAASTRPFTRLSLEPRDCEGATFASTALPAATALAQRVADVLRLNVPASSLFASLAAALSRERRLLLIENVDSQAQSRAVGALVSRLPGCAILISARQKNWGMTAGWMEREVRPLATDDSVRLLRAEITSTAADAISDSDLQWLAAQLGNLPLALHIAAAHLARGYSVRGFVDELKTQGFKAEPAAGDPALADDMARAILEPSFRLAWQHWQTSGLADDMVVALLPLAHAPAEGVGASLGAALCGMTPNEFERLRITASAYSLLETDDANGARDRSRIHPLLAEWLREHCTDSPAAARQQALARLTDWFCERLPDDAERGPRWSEVGTEWSALRQLLETCDSDQAIRVLSAGMAYSVLSGPFAWWASFCDRHQATAAGSDRSNFLWTLTGTARRAGDIERALSAAQEKARLDRDRTDDRGVALALGAQADIFEARGQLDQALGIRENDELPVYERLGDVRSAAVTKGQIASIFEARGQLDHALAIRENDELPVFERLGDVRSAAVTKGRIADILQARGQLDQALAIRENDVLPVFEQLGDVRLAAVTKGKIADIFQTRGELGQALAIRENEVLPVFEQLGDVRLAAVTKGKIADIFEARGQLDQALAIRENDELPAYERLGDVRSAAACKVKIADIFAARGQLDDAERLLQREALPVFEQIGYTREAQQVHERLAAIKRLRNAKSLI